jgi:hypothetical protein
LPAPEDGDFVELLLLLSRALSSRGVVLIIRLVQEPQLEMLSVIPPRPYVPSWSAQTKSSISSYLYTNNNNNNNNNNNLLTASGLSPGGSGYFTFKLRQTY